MNPVNVKDRVVQYPSRYQLTQVSTDVYDFTPVPGTITEVGTDINKALLQPIVDELSINEPVSLPLTPTTSIQSVTDSYDGIIDAEIGGATLYNAGVNFNFANGITGWTPAGTTLSVLNKVLSITGNGSSNLCYAYASTQIKYKAGTKIFCYAKFKATNAVCAVANLTIANLSGANSVSIDSQLTPAQNVSYDMYGIGTLSVDSDTVRLFIDHRYNDAATANGKTMEVDGNVGVFAIPITGTPYENMDANQIYAMVNEYFEGLKSTNELSILSRGKNFVDKTSVLNGKFLDANGNEASDATFSISDYMRVKPSTVYTIQGVTNSNVGSNNDTITWYDKYKNKISTIAFSKNGATLSSPSNAWFSRLSIAILDLETAMMSEGSTALPYEPYKNSILSVNCTDDTKFALSKLPNLVQDEVNQASGYISAVKRNERYTLKSADITAYQTGVNCDFVEINSTNFSNHSVWTNGIATDVLFPGFSPSTYPPADSVASIGTHSHSGGNVLMYLAVAKGTYADVNAARTDLVTTKQTKLQYNRATPVFIPFEDFPDYGLNVEGALASHSGYTNVSYEADIVPNATLQYPVTVASSVRSISNNLLGLIERVDDVEQDIVDLSSLSLLYAYKNIGGSF